MLHLEALSNEPAPETSDEDGVGVELAPRAANDDGCGCQVAPPGLLPASHSLLTPALLLPAAPQKQLSAASRWQVLGGNGGKGLGNESASAQWCVSKRNGTMCATLKKGESWVVKQWPQQHGLITSFKPERPAKKLDSDQEHRMIKAA